MKIIRGGTIIAYDGTAHRRLDDGVVVIDGDSIVHVGRSWEGEADETLDVRGKIVIPGHVSTHAHVSAQETSRITGEARFRRFVRNGFLHFMPTRRSGAPGLASLIDERVSVRFGFAALVRSGVTSVVAFSDSGSEMLQEVADEMGIRLFYSPAITNGTYFLEDDGSVSTEIDEKLGMRQLEDAVQFVEDRCNPGGRLQGMIIVDEYYLSTPELRIRAKAAAIELGVPFSMHFLEQHREFFDTMITTGATPVQLLADEGILDPRTLLAHCVYVDSHRLVSYPVSNDIGILGKFGTNVAHSPAAFALSGIALESFDRYNKAGVNVALGTDAFPLDMFDEMRTASTMGKAAEMHFEAAQARDIFAASNIAGAKALGRNDLGKIAPGAKADIVIVDPASLGFGPAPDPVTMLVKHGHPSLVDTVIVDGRTLMSGGRITICDEDAIIAEAMEAMPDFDEAWRTYHPSGKQLTESFPHALQPWQD